MPYHIITIGYPSKILKNQYTKYQKLLSAEENEGRAEDPFQYFQEGASDSDSSFENVIPFNIDPNKLN